MFLLRIRKYFIYEVTNDFSLEEELSFYRNWKLEKAIWNIGKKKKRTVFEPHSVCTSTLVIDMITWKGKISWGLKSNQ